MSNDDPTPDPTVTGAYKDVSRIITALVVGGPAEAEANQTLEALAYNAPRHQLVHLLMAALHTAAEMVTREAAAAVLAGDTAGGPALDALSSLWRRAAGLDEGEA